MKIITIYFYQACYEHHVCQPGLNLPAYLITVVQRIPRYLLLLEVLVSQVIDLRYMYYIKQYVFHYKQQGHQITKWGDYFSGFFQKDTRKSPRSQQPEQGFDKNGNYRVYFLLLPSIYSVAEFSEYFQLLLNRAILFSHVYKE